MLNHDIVYDNADKEMLYSIIDKKMNDFLQRNISKLILILPKMQFFMSYYKKCQDDIMFFVDTKHLFMVIAMMHVLETILTPLDKKIEEITKIVKKLSEQINTNEEYFVKSEMT